MRANMVHEAPGGPRRLRRPQETKVATEASGSPKRPQKGQSGYGGSQEASGGSRRAKVATEAPGSPRRPQEGQHGYGCFRRLQEVPGGPKWLRFDPLFWDSSPTTLASSCSAQVLCFVAPSTIHHGVGNSCNGGLRHVLRYSR